MVIMPPAALVSVWVLLGSASRWTAHWSQGLYFRGVCLLSLTPNSPRVGSDFQEVPISWDPGSLSWGGHKVYAVERI